MTKTDAPRLLDVLTRHQIYLEGLKDHEGRKFDAVMTDLRRDLRSVFLDVEYDELSQLTRRQLNQLIRRLRRTQQKHFTVYTQKVLDSLRRFTEADTAMNVEIMRQTQEEDKTALAALAALLGARKLSALWRSVMSSPMPANGITPDAYITLFAVSAGDDLENAVRRAHANKLRTGDALRSIVGTSRLNHRDGVVNKFGYRARGLVGTILQHAAGIVQARVASQYFAEYRWVAILDSRTSDICRSRHERVYAYGKGPLPPAHPNCRSKTVPFIRDDEDIPDSYYAWLKKQPRDVQNDILGSRRASGLRAGNIKSSDISKFNDVSPLTLAKFKDKLRLILAP